MKAPTLLVSLLLLALAALGLLMPWFTRRDLFFGVTVSPEFRGTQSARRVVRTYRGAVCGVTAAALGILFAVERLVGRESRPAWAASQAALFAYLIGTCAVLVIAHHFALRYATPRASAVEVDLSASPERIPGGPVAPWLPFGWLYGLGLWAGFNAKRLPQRFIVHWGMHGPDRWVTTTPESVTALLALTAFMCLILTAMAYGTIHWSRRISTSGAAASSERRFRGQFVLLLLALEYLIAVLPAFALLSAPQLALHIWSAALIATLIFFVLRLIRAGQGGARLVGPTGTTPLGDRTDDARWLGGLIYVNRADPALLVEKRMGLGWTFNLGNPWAWAMVAGLLAIPVVIRLLLAK
jgi:uncharacterized membrane protein